MSQSTLCKYSVDSVVPTEALCMFKHTLYIRSKQSIKYIYKCTYINAPTLEANAPVVFIVWLWAW